MVQMENQTNLECCSFFGSTQEHVANNNYKKKYKFIYVHSPLAQKGVGGENICCEKVQPIRMNSLTMGA